MDTAAFEKRYDWKNLTPAQRLVARETGFSYHWLVSFLQPTVLAGMVRMAGKLLKLRHGKRR